MPVRRRRRASTPGSSRGPDTRPTVGSLMYISGLISARWTLTYSRSLMSMPADARLDRRRDQLPVGIDQRDEHRRMRQRGQFLRPAVEPEAGRIGADFARGQVHGGADRGQRVIHLLAERRAEIAGGRGGATERRLAHRPCGHHDREPQAHHQAERTQADPARQSDRMAPGLRRRPSARRRSDRLAAWIRAS